MWLTKAIKTKRSTASPHRPQTSSGQQPELHTVSSRSQWDPIGSLCRQQQLALAKQLATVKSCCQYQRLLWASERKLVHNQRFFFPAWQPETHLATATHAGRSRAKRQLLPRPLPSQPFSQWQPHPTFTAALVACILKNCCWKPIAVC